MSVVIIWVMVGIVEVVLVVAMVREWWWSPLRANGGREEK